jgi:protein-S-isoprenylcysteine O-methyltransferase Ste14
MQRWRVPLGFMAAAVFLFFASPTWWTLVTGGMVALAGLALRAWSAGHIRKNQKLAISGPYAWTRNPLYLGSFILGLGFTIASNQPVLVLLFAALFLGIYLSVMRVEARTLAELFGNDYRDYAAAVPLFFPRLTPLTLNAPDENIAKFDGSLYIRYREYQATLGALGAWGILAAKTVFLS